jgi:hypothetical protein
MAAQTHMCEKVNARQWCKHGRSLLDPKHTFNEHKVKISSLITEPRTLAEQHCIINPKMCPQCLGKHVNVKGVQRYAPLTPARWFHELCGRPQDIGGAPWLWTYHFLFISFPTITCSLPPPFTHFWTILQWVPGTSKLLDSREISCINLQFGNLCSPRRQQRFSVVCRMHTVTPPLLFFTVLNKSIYKTI